MIYPNCLEQDLGEVFLTLVFVDDPTTYPNTKNHSKTWSRLWTDRNLDELHQLAEEIGLLRTWFIVNIKLPVEFQHYELRPSGRIRALERGAVPISFPEFLQLKANGKVWGR